MPWIIAVALTVLLAKAGHTAATPSASGAAMVFAVNLAAMTLAAVMAAIGAYLSTRRHVATASNAAASI
jgi:hypothetical protein